MCNYPKKGFSPFREKLSFYQFAIVNGPSVILAWIETDTKAKLLTSFYSTFKPSIQCLFNFFGTILAR